MDFSPEDLRKAECLPHQEERELLQEEIEDLRERVQMYKEFLRLIRG